MQKPEGRGEAVLLGNRRGQRLPGTQPCTGPCCQLGVGVGSCSTEPVYPRMGPQAGCNQMCMFQRLLSQLLSLDGGVQQLKRVLDLVHSPGLSRYCQEPRKMMVEPSRAGEQTGLSDVIGV